MSKKSELQDKAMKILMDSATNDPIKPKFKELLKTLLVNSSSLFVLLECLQKRNQMQFSIQIFEILQAHFAKTKFNEEESQKIANSFISIINSELPSNINKLELNTINYLQSSAAAAQYFPTYFKNVDTTNQYVQTFLIFIYVFTHNVELKDKVMPLMNQKLIYNVQSLAILRSLPNNELAEQPTVRALSTVFKSSFDNNLGDYTIPIILSCLPHYMNETSSKECASMIPIILKKLKRDNHNMVQFSRFLFPLFEFNDTFLVVKASSDDILQAYITTVNDCATITSPAELSDPLTYVNGEVANAFIKLCAALSVNICLLLQTKCVQYPTGVLLLSIYVARMISVNEFDRCDRENMIADLLTVCPRTSSNFHLLIILSGYFVVGFSSKRGLEILVDGLAMNSRQACNWIVSDEMPFDIVFPVLATQFDADKSCELYLHTLISLLKVNVPQIPDELPIDDSVTAYSDSNFESISSLSRFNSDNMDISDLQGVPTPATTLFCHVISKYINHPELGALVPLAAASVSQQFAIDLTRNMKQQKRKRAKLELVASYSNALQSLDVQTLHSLAQTFLLLSPGMPMLFLAVSLQRLPPEAIKRMMQKTVAFASTSTESFAKMVALVAHSHPEIALSFLDNFTESNVIKRRVFFFLRANPEDNEPAYIATFQTIGYFCTFVDNGFFINEFLPFATRFLNKHLTHNSKSHQFNTAQLMAIKRISNRLIAYQGDHNDHIFPFKDFLVQFVCSLFMDVGDSILSPSSTQPKSNKSTQMVVAILQTLTALLPIHPIRINDRHDRSIELIVLILQFVSGDEFTMIFKAASGFILELMRTNPSVLVLNSILGPMFQSLLCTKEWRAMCSLTMQITSLWETVKLVQGGPYLSQLVGAIGPMLTSVLPILASDIGSTAITIVENLCNLQCAIRNQILNLPRNIRPSIPSIENADAAEILRIGCVFTCKNLMTSQVFDVIGGLLDYAVGDKIVETHIRGCILAATHLLSERGNEEFRDDAKIVALLAKAANKDDDLLDVCIKALKVLASMRFFSIVSSLVAHKSEVEPFASKIIAALLETEGAAMQMLSVVSEMSVDESQDNSWFTSAAFPQLSDAVKESSDEQWAKIFMGVAKLTKDSSSPVFTSLFKAESMEEILDKAEDERPLVFTMLTSLLPEGYDVYFSHLSLELAAASVENCSALLSYFFTDVRAADETTFEHLLKILTKHPYEGWREHANTLAILIADNIFSSPAALKCAHSYIDHCDDDSLTFIWAAIISHVISDFEKWLAIIDELSYRIDPVSFTPILPILVVRAKNAVCAKVLSLIADKVAANISGDVVSKVLKSDIYQHIDLVSEFSTMLKRNDHAAESVAALAILCESISETNSYAIEAIIDEAIRSNGDEDTCAISVLQGLIL